MTVCASRVSCVTELHRDAVPADLAWQRTFLVRVPIAQSVVHDCISVDAWRSTLLTGQK
jgi:hypothetical protein